MAFAGHPFVVGSVIGGLVTGLVGGILLGVLDVATFTTVLAANAAVTALICWWRPGLDSAAWKLWLAATLANPLLLAALGWSVEQWQCLAGLRRGWDCIVAGVGPLVALSCLPPPLIGLLARRLVGRRPAG